MNKRRRVFLCFWGVKHIQQNGSEIRERDSSSLWTIEVGVVTSGDTDQSNYCSDHT